MYQALYRKWRPRSFDDVSGQEHITSVLKYETEHNKISHAYLFCGSRGVGKTTCAKILAKAINCENPVNGNPCGKCKSCLAIEAGTATDVLEMDAASNNGVDSIRDIRDEVVFAPSELKYRVYIVDEVHMLSQSAFNALLKTLEEPPSYVVFILATTEQHKLPATIISRCQRFEFRRISTGELSARIELIASNEGIEIEHDASHLIARLAQGGMRDAISLLELCAGNAEKITVQMVCDTVGSTGRESTMRLTEAIADKNYTYIFDEIAELTASSKSIPVFWQDVISMWRDMLVFRTTKDAPKYLDLTDSETERLGALALRFTRETLLWQCRLLDDALAKMTRNGTVARTIAEITLMRLCDEKLDDSGAALLSRISKLEERLAGGEAVTVAPVSEVKKSEKKNTTTNGEPKSVKAATVTDSPEKKTTESKTTENKKTVEVKTDNGRVLRPMREWADVIAEIGDMVLGSMLSQVKAYVTGNGEVILKAENAFMKDMTDSPENRSAISRALTAVTGRAYNIFTETEDKTVNDTVIDEILENAEERKDR